MECSSGKVPYWDRSYAKKRCKQIKRQGGNKHMKSTKLRPYRCMECQMWHLTNTATLPGNDLVEVRRGTVR